MKPRLVTPGEIRLVHALKESLLEILGQQEGDMLFTSLPILGEILPDVNPSPDREFPLAVIVHLQNAMELHYGARAGKGLCQRIGRSLFKHLLQEFGSDLQVTDMSFRLLPLPARLEVGTRLLTDKFNLHAANPVDLVFGSKSISWHAENHCPLQGDLSADQPRCALVVGLLQEAFSWVSGGRYFQVHEKECAVCGSARCSIAVDLASTG